MHCVKYPTQSQKGLLHQEGAIVIPFYGVEEVRMERLTNSNNCTLGLNSSVP